MTESGFEDPSELKPQRRKRRKTHPLRRKKKSNEELSITINQLEKYCLACVTWIDAKPLVDMMEKFFGMDPPPPVMRTIDRIKNHFKQLNGGKVIKAKKIIMKHNHFKSMNEITKNKQVNLGK